MLERIGHKLGPGREPELGHDVGSMRLDSPYTDNQLLGNLVVGVSMGEQGENFPLSIRELVQAGISHDWR
jgi:hypothetical protein